MFGWLGILTIFIFLGLGLYFIKNLWIGDNKPNTFGGYFAAFFMTVVTEGIAFFAFMVFSLLIGIFHYPKYTENIYGGKVPIYSIGLNNSVEGHFTLGCGSVNGKSTYRYFAKIKGGGYKCFEVDADKTTIIETDGCKPYIQFVKGKRCTCDGNFLMRAYFGDNEDFWRGSIKKYKEQIIYIPKGSIIQTYEIRP